MALSIGGAKVEASAVKAAFEAASAAGLPESGKLVSLPPAASKIAAALGLGEEVYTGVGNARRRGYPAALVARAEEALGLKLALSVISDPEREAADKAREAAWREAEAAEDARREAARRARPLRHGSRGWKNSYPRDCDKCGARVEPFAGVDCDRWREGDLRSEAVVTLCSDCFSAAGSLRSPFYHRPPRDLQPRFQGDDALDSLEAEDFRNRTKPEASRFG